MRLPSAYVAGVGLIGPGLEGWPAAAEVLRGERAYESRPTEVPPVTVLPPVERRRTGLTVRLALAVGLEAVRRAQRDPAGLAAVFASSGGDARNCHEICSTLASPERALSPTRFHNSVHNAAAGYWTIAAGTRAAAAVVCAHDGSFAAGLLEALTQVTLERQPVLLVAHDTAFLPPLAAKRPIPDAFGVALVLTSERRTALGTLQAGFTQEAAGPMADRALEQMRATIPAARALPLLAPLATGEEGTVVLDYLEGLQLQVRVNVEERAARSHRMAAQVAL